MKFKDLVVGQSDLGKGGWGFAQNYKYTHRTRVKRGGNCHSEMGVCRLWGPSRSAR